MDVEAGQLGKDVSPSFIHGSTDVKLFDPYAAVIDPNALAGVTRNYRYGCHIGPHRLLLDSGVLSEVLIKADVFPLPNGPRYLIGLTNLRGNLTPVFDVHSWLGVDSNVTKIKSLFVIDRGEEAAGFFIDGLPVAVDVDQASPAEQPKDFPNLVRGMSAEALSLDGKIWTSVKHRALFERIAREY